MSHSHPTDSVSLDAHSSRIGQKNGTKYRILNFLSHQSETVSGRAGGSAFNEFAFSLLSYLPRRPFFTPVLIGVIFGLRRL